MSYAYLSCPECGGEGQLYTSRYGGNDPDVWSTGACDDPHCDGGQIRVDTSAIRHLVVARNYGHSGRFAIKAIDAGWTLTPDLPIGFGFDEVAAVRDLLDWIETETDDAAYEATVALEAAQDILCDELHVLFADVRRAA